MSEGPVSLEDLGWRAPFAEAFQALAVASQGEPGRVILQQRGRYTVVTEAGERPAELENRFRKGAHSAADLPCVGDWVVVRRTASKTAIATICALLPRLTKFSRKAAGPEHAEQVLAANVDTLFIAMGLDGDFNVRRLERYLTVAWASGGHPVILLTKADLCAADELAARVAEVRATAPNVDVVCTSVPSAGADGDDRAVETFNSLAPFLGQGQTVVLLGSSGVGKSTLVNALLQRNALRTGEVRASDSRGRHTTTQRQLFWVRGGALIIDSPGIRELQLWDAGAGLGDSFADVHAVAGGCRFRDCRHQDEPDCAVVAAVARGDLSQDRLASYRKLKDEQSSSSSGGDPEAARRRKRAGTSGTKSPRKKDWSGVP